MRFAHKRIAISRSIERLIATKYGKSCEVIPNGVVFSELPSAKDRIVELGLEPGRYVLTVGRLVPEKRQMDLLRAFRDAGLDGWKLAIVGRIDHKNKYADLLASEAAVMENVVMAGFQSGEALRQLYAHAGLFVLPSSHEGLPIVLLEALSYGPPVLGQRHSLQFGSGRRPRPYVSHGGRSGAGRETSVLADHKLDAASARQSGVIVSVAMIGTRSLAGLRQRMKNSSTRIDAPRSRLQIRFGRRSDDDDTA